MRAGAFKKIISLTFIVIFCLTVVIGYDTARGANKSESLLTSKNAWHSNTNKAEAAPGEYIVKFKKGLSNSSKVQVMNKHSFKEKKDLKIINAKLVSLGSKTEQEQQTLIAEIRKDPAVEYIEPNYYLYPSSTYISSDTYASELWGLKNIGQNIIGSTGLSGIDINLEQAWQISKGSPSVVVAVIDSGTDISHPDLAGNIWTNPGEIAGNGLDDDGNGKTDDVKGWDFFYDDNTVFHDETQDEHGTHCSGTIAALENNAGVVGVAPLVKILPLKFIGYNANTGKITGLTSDAIDAIQYAKQMGVIIASNSWGGAGYNTSLRDAIAASGMIFIAAAGNDGTNNDTTPFYPACYDLPNIISVAAINNIGYLASFSNYGASSVDVAAPGVLICSTVPGSNYVYMDGTSMAAPHVAGIAALMVSTGVTDPAAIKSKILASATHNKLDNLSGKILTEGLVDAAYCISEPPVASNVVINGTARVGQMLHGNYSYSDNEGDPEGASILQWYRDDSVEGTTKVAISGAASSTYTLTADDLNKYIFFSVSPVALTGVSPGDTVTSAVLGPVGEALASPLTALSIREGNDGSGKDLINNFSTSEMNYLIRTNSEVTALTIDYTVADPDKNTVTVNYNNTVVEGNSIALIEDANVITIVVHEEGKGDLTYTINISVMRDHCFIATAAFGSKFTPAVKLLRAFRDDYLLTNAWGRQFVAFYYHYSPPIAHYIADREALRGLTRILLAPFVAAVYLLYHKMFLLLFILLIGWFVYWRNKPYYSRSLSNQS